MPEARGYEYVRAYEAERPDRSYFRRPRVDPRTLHVHSVVTGSAPWIRYLAFRDYLRSQTEVATAYAELKADLASRLSRTEYTEAKRPFIERILAAAHY